MSLYHDISDVVSGNDALSMTIDGERYIFPYAEISNRLSKASNEERTRFEISPSGYGIHWPLLDEDLSVDGMLGISHEIPSKLAA